LRCSNCGRELGEGAWKVCPGCGADPSAAPAGQPTVNMPAVPQQPGAYPGYPPQAGTPYRQYPQTPYPQPGQPYRQPTQAYPQGYAAPGAQQGYAAGYAPAAGKPGGSVLLGILTMLLGAVVVGSTFLQWVTTPMGAGVNITGWFVMQGGFEVFGGGFNVVLSQQGTIFFTGFFSLLLGALVLLGGIVTLIRRRPGGVLTLLFALAASVLSAVNITMVFAKMEGSSPGVGLYLFAGASLAALVLGIISLSSSS
jgi:hypothetical protein